MSCTHLTAKDHKKGLRWVCSHCRLVFDWSDTSSYFGNWECLKCGFTRVLRVFCSYDCRKSAPDWKPTKDGAFEDATIRWRPNASSGMGPVPAGESAPSLALAPADEGDAAEAAHSTGAPRSAFVVLTEQELMEIMVALVEASKDKFCGPERSARISALLEHKIDPAVSEARLGKK